MMKIGMTLFGNTLTIIKQLEFRRQFHIPFVVVQAQKFDVL